MGSRTRGWPQGQRGTSFVEVLVAMGILAAVGMTFLNSLSGGLMAVDIRDERVTAEVLAQTQLEDAKGFAYQTAPCTYPTTVNTPPGYSVTVECLPITGADGNIQKVRVTVSRDGDQLLVLDGFKVNR